MFSVLLLTVWSVARAQGDVQFSDFTTLKSYYNPAVSGSEGMLNVSGGFSMQAAGFRRNPSTLYIGADMPVYFLTPRHGGGVSYVSDMANPFTTTKISLMYAYNFKIGQKSRLAVGVQGGIISMTLDGGKLELEDNSDPAFPKSKSDGNSVDLSAGVYFRHGRMWAGLSAQHLTAPSVTLGDLYHVETTRCYYLMGGYNIKLKNSLFTLQPAFLVSTTLKSWRGDIQCKALYERDEKKFYIGAGYCPGTSATVLVGGVFHGIGLGYSYQIHTGGMGIEHGTHEVALNYQTELDLFKKGRNKHKTVRWL